MLDLFTSQQNRDKGIEQALKHANEVQPLWSEKAYNCLLRFIQWNDEFMTEDLREFASLSLPEPPSNRAWGGIIVRAVKNGLIERKGFKNVKNAKAHCTPATLWKTVK
jgi:hypothetical protein